jgi:hypothetical protein
MCIFFPIISFKAADLLFLFDDADLLILFNAADLLFLFDDADLSVPFYKYFFYLV